MKICPKCNKELKDTAKFCGGCGYKFPVEAASETVQKESVNSCPNCGSLLKSGAKFCGKCGARIQAVAAPQNADNAAQSDAKQLEAVGNSGFVRWTMLPGQIAVKITEKEFDDYGKIKGLVRQSF